MNIKKLTPKQALVVVESIVKSNSLDLKILLEEDSLKVVYTGENSEQAKNLVLLFSGTNPKNKQDLIPNDSGNIYLVNKGTLFTADVHLDLEEENHFNVDALDSILAGVLDDEPKEVVKSAKKGKTADDLNDWIALLEEIKISGHKQLHYIENDTLVLLAEKLKNLYNTANAPLNKVLVGKFLEQYVAREVSEDYFLNNFVEASYKRLYSQHGKLKEGLSGVMHKLPKTEHYASLLLVSTLDSYIAQNKVYTLVENIAKPDVEVASSMGWYDYLVTLGLESETILDINEYIEKNDLAEVDPKKELSGLYTLVQSKMAEVKDLAYKRSGIKNTRAEKNLDKYLDKTYFGKETPEKLRNVLDAYSLIESIGSYIDWLIQICENYMVGYAEVGVENEQEVEETQEVEDVENHNKTHLNFDGEEETEEESFKIYLQYTMQLTDTEINTLMEETYNYEPDRFMALAHSIFIETQKEIKTAKKRVVDSLGLQPSVSNKNRNITNKVNKYLKETYLGENEIVKGNSLKLFTKVKSENSTISKELEELYKQEVENYNREHTNALENILNAEDIDFVKDRAGITTILRSAETDGTQTQEAVLAIESRILVEYNKDLAKKVYDKSKDVIQEYKKLFGHAK